MTASENVKAVDAIQSALRPTMKAHGFKVRGRTFNRVTDDGLVQVVNLQMGPFDPPGITYFPGLRENVYGLFTVNLGVLIPEGVQLQGQKVGAWVREYDCWIRSRLEDVSGVPSSFLWRTVVSPEVIDDVRMRLAVFGLPFLDRFATRDRILAELEGESANLEHCHTPRVLSALIRYHRGERDAAKALLAMQEAGAREVHPGHAGFVRELAERLGLGEL